MSSSRPTSSRVRLPAKYVDLAPKFITNEDGTNAWLYEGQVLPNVALNAVAGRPREEYGLEPTSFDQLRPGCYDIDERVKDMDANGVLGSLCFPSFPQFCGQLFARTEDKDVALAMIRAYNDWHIDEWCGTHKGRFIPCPSRPSGIPRCWPPRSGGPRPREPTPSPSRRTRPSSDGPVSTRTTGIRSGRRAATRHVVVCMHIGSSSDIVITSPDAPIDCLITLTPMNIVQAAADLVWSPVLRKFPDLKVALSEGGIGWIPYFLERVDYNYDRHHAWTGQDFGDQLPSQVFNQHVLTCFIDDHFGVISRDYLDMDNVMWECDYPHSDSTWPTAPETLTKSLDGVSDHDIDRITHLNAMRHFHYDPFTELGGKANCTVGALRKQAVGHDVSTQLAVAGEHRQDRNQVGRPAGHGQEVTGARRSTSPHRSTAPPPAPTSH